MKYLFLLWMMFFMYAAIEFSIAVLDYVERISNGYCRDSRHGWW